MSGGERVAVVVGASGAIGRVVTARLVEGGWRIVAVARAPEGLAEIEGERVVACPADVTADDAPARIAAAVGSSPVGLLVHVASAPLGGHVQEVEPKALRAAFEVKVVALVRLVRALRFASPARVVAIGGNLAFDPVAEGSTAGVANAAQANLVRMLDAALAPSGVTVHTVAPGPVRTPRFADLAATRAREEGVSVDEVVAAATEAAPTGELTTPEQIAWAVERLTDPEATALAGGTLLLDHGRRTALP